MVVSAPSISKVNCYLINNLLPVSKRCCSKCWNANGRVTHRIESNESTGQSCRATGFVFSHEKKIATRKTLRGGKLHISAVFVNRFTRRCEESLEFILARHGMEYKYLCAITLPLLFEFLSFFLNSKGKKWRMALNVFHCWHHAANTRVGGLVNGFIVFFCLAEPRVCFSWSERVFKFAASPSSAVCFCAGGQTSGRLHH